MQSAEWSHLTRRQHGITSYNSILSAGAAIAKVLRLATYTLPPPLGFQLLMSVVISGEATWHIISLYHC